LTSAEIAATATAAAIAPTATTVATTTATTVAALFATEATTVTTVFATGLFATSGWHKDGLGRDTEQGRELTLQRSPETNRCLHGDDDGFNLDTRAIFATRTVFATRAVTFGTWAVAFVTWAVTFGTRFTWFAARASGTFGARFTGVATLAVTRGCQAGGLLRQRRLLDGLRDGDALRGEGGRLQPEVRDVRAAAGSGPAAWRVRPRGSR